MSREALRFKRLELRSMPGLEEGGFSLADLSAGVNLIHGPNGVGKTTTARAIRLLLWPAGEAAQAHSVFAQATLGGARWTLELDHGVARRLRDGQAEEGPALPPAEEADRYNLALHDLLSADLGDRFAALLRREMAGGYDLRRAAQAAGARATPSTPRKLVQSLRHAERRVESLQAEQRALDGRALDLDRLRQGLRRARDSRQRLVGVEAALAWHELERARQQAERSLAGLPPAVERLHGNELEQSRELAERVESARRDRRQAAEASVAARQRLAETGLPQGGAPKDLLARVRERCDSLRGIEERLAEAGRSLASARARHEEARRALGLEVSDELLRGVDAAAWRELGELERKQSMLRGELLQVADLERWLGDAPQEEVSASLRRTIDLLRQRLRLGEPPSGWTAWRRSLPALAGSLALLILAILGGLRLAPGLWLLAVLAAGLTLWAWLEARRDEHADRRRLLDRDLRSRSGMEAAREGPAEELAHRLDELEARQASAALEEIQREKRRELEVSASALRPRVAELESERGALVERIGLAPRVASELEPAPLAALVQRMLEWQRADSEARGREAEIEAERGRRDELLACLKADLTPFGIAPPADHAEARGASEVLLERAETFARARGELDRLEGEGGAVARAEESLASLEAARRELFAALELDQGDEEGLRRLLSLRPRWEEAGNARRAARERQRELVDKLEGEKGLLKLSSADLTRTRDELAEQAGRHDELLGDIREVETLTREARRETRLEGALAERRAAREALAGQREGERQALVTDLVALWLRRRSRTRSEPAVLRRAAELFASITRGRYELVEPRGEPPEFSARESASGRFRSLAELSSGTRLQLLVAVRMAFVERQEQGPMLPLVLDETLANCDDWAAPAVIEAVAELAADGRQVFYFTAQEDEVGRWLEVLEGRPGLPFTVVDLGRLRFGDEAARAPLRTEPALARSVPAAGTMSRREYGEAIGAPGIDPRRDAGAVHLWHLVEEPGVLEQLQAAGIERWGQLETMLVEGVAADLLGRGGSAVRRRRVEARARCIELLIGSWRQGRGRAVSRPVLRDSGAISDRYLEPVTDLAAEVQGDARDLIAALRGRRVPRFQSQKTDDLERFLVEEGYLDERPVLDMDELRRRALAGAASDIEGDLISIADVDELLAQLPAED